MDVPLPSVHRREADGYKSGLGRLLKRDFHSLPPLPEGEKIKEKTVFMQGVEDHLLGKLPESYFLNILLPRPGRSP
jgi:hypothetical protein